MLTGAMSIIMLGSNSVPVEGGTLDQQSGMYLSQQGYFPGKPTRTLSNPTGTPSHNMVGVIYKRSFSLVNCRFLGSFAIPAVW